MLGDVCIYFYFIYPGCTMWRSSFADKQVNNIQVIVMYSNMQRSQTILKKTKTEVQAKAFLMF